MAERTEHGQERHQQDDRPTAEAFADWDNPREVYQDVESGYSAYKVLLSELYRGEGGGIRQYL